MYGPYRYNDHISLPFVTFYMSISDVITAMEGYIRYLARFICRLMFLILERMFIFLIYIP